MSVKLLTEHHLEFLGLKGGCTGSSESSLVKMTHCWKSHVTAHLIHYNFQCFEDFLKELIGDDVIDDFKKNFVGEYLDIFKEFEVLFI